MMFSLKSIVPCLFLLAVFAVTGLAQTPPTPPRSFPGSSDVLDPSLKQLAGQEIPEEVFAQFERAFGTEAVLPFRLQAKLQPDYNPAGKHPTLLLKIQPWFGRTAPGIDATDFMNIPMVRVQSTALPTSPEDIAALSARLKRVDLSFEDFKAIVEARRKADFIVNVFDLLKLGMTLEEIGLDRELLTLQGIPVNQVPVRGIDYDPEPAISNLGIQNFRANTKPFTVGDLAKAHGWALIRCLEAAQVVTDEDGKIVRNQYGDPVLLNDPNDDTEEVVRAEALFLLRDFMPGLLITIWNDGYLTRKELMRRQEMGIPLPSGRQAMNRAAGGFPNTRFIGPDGNFNGKVTLRYCPSDPFDSVTGSRLGRFTIVAHWDLEIHGGLSTVVGPAMDASGFATSAGPFFRDPLTPLDDPLLDPRAPGDDYGGN